MKKIAILDTSILSFNLGDQIIMESARHGLQSITQNAFVVNMPTHSPLFHRYEFSLRGIDSFQAALNEIDYKFVCGTNLITGNMKKRKNSWNLNILDLKYFNNFILVGVGSCESICLDNNYTKKFYQKALSHDFYHSTRDEKTKNFLESIGIKAINTGCVTLWSLNKDHCKRIPTHKSTSVVFTITDYKPDKILDKKMIEILLENYKSLYFWPQGFNDISYLRTIIDIEKEKRIIILPPSLNGFVQLLDTTECDYVGTRLHAGIKAMQAGKRSIIIGVDNRAKDINDDYHLNYIVREEIYDINNMINSEVVTDIHINQERITKFLKQFV